MDGRFVVSPCAPQGYFAYRYDADGCLYAVFRHGEELVDVDEAGALASATRLVSCGRHHLDWLDERRDESLCPRKLCALQIWVTTPNPPLWSVIAPVDRDVMGGVLWPAHPDHTWLDVKAGDVVVGRGRRTDRVERIDIFRAYPTTANGSTITCGRDWLEGRC